ncbi:TetR/AcrR family transcriptional regulator [Ramlibacter sp. PS4R-6]|uniref:TetR/AcrR family transcriptional regulator n=1 Tax=Ramlibacter sp. PS4R-6 TaxID=3133438 RepID=UPI0030A7A06F
MEHRQSPATGSRKQLTHDRIVDTAARVLRETGFAGVGVADIMKRAGLTHGGFYAHFESRDALLAEALQRAGEDSRTRLRQSIEAAHAKGVSPFRAMVETYLADSHLKSPETGCPVAALSSEMPRQAPAVREQASTRVQALVAGVESVLPAGRSKEDAAIVAAQLVGALQVARALGDNAAGRRHLARSRQFVVEQFDSPQRRGR